MDTDDHKSDRKLSKEELKRLEKEIASVKYGTVSIIVQDGVIVQIEKNEKFRLR